VARFRQVNTDEPHLHHDALEFSDGQIVLVTRLCAGQHAIVLQLPAAARTRDAQETGSALRSWRERLQDGSLVGEI